MTNAEFLHCKMSSMQDDEQKTQTSATLKQPYEYIYNFFGPLLWDHHTDAKSSPPKCSLHTPVGLSME